LRLSSGADTFSFRRPENAHTAVLAILCKLPDHAEDSVPYVCGACSKMQPPIRRIAFGVWIAMRQPLTTVSNSNQEIIKMHDNVLKWIVRAKVIAQAIKEEHGQDLVEYAAVIALVVLGLAAGMTTLANGINTAMDTVSTKVQNKLS